MKENINNDLLLEVYGSKTFVKVYQALEIGKIKFSFAEKDNVTDGIDCYVNADDFASDLIKKITDQRLLKACAVEKQRAASKNEKYCQDIWKSRAGIDGEKNVRSFSIQPGSSTEMVFRASKNGKNIIVGFEYRELELLAYRWSFLEADWNKKMAERYSLSNMKNSFYSPDQTKKQPESAVSQDFKSTPPSDTPVPMDKAKYMVSGNASAKKANTTPSPDQNAGSAARKSKVYKLKVVDGMQPMTSGNRALKAITVDNISYPVIFEKNLLALPHWQAFEKRAVPGSIIMVTGWLYKDRIIVTKIAS